MAKNETGPDNGVFNFVNLFSNSLLGKEYDILSKTEKEKLIKRFEHKVNGHMPLWIRLPLSKIKKSFSQLAVRF